MSKQVKKYSEEELNNVLWAAADSSRTAIDASIYKDYVLVMLFFKYLSDLSKKRREEYRVRFDNDKERIEEKMKLDRFYLPPKTSFDYIYSILEEDNIGEELNKILGKIEDANEAKLGGVFSVDFNSESILGKLEDRNKMIRDLIKDFAKIDLTDVDDDVIGNAYMYMIERFGADAGKKAGEFFSPSQVSAIVAKLAQPKEGDRIADFACGSGGMLLLAGKEVEKGGSQNYALYGQESKGSTYQLCRMNMFLHGKDDARIEWGDTLNNPQLTENDNLMKFDIVVANPPYSLDKWGAENAEGDKYNRFFRGIPPKGNGDYAFITHMVETLKPKSGRGVIVVPHGVLFRAGAEGKIRRRFLEENIVDAVIGLPGKLFQTTDIPVVLLIIDRSREEGAKNENRKDIFFIEASKEFVAGSPKNTLSEKNIQKIYDTYIKRKDVEKFARVVNPKEIEENDFNLNITRYVDTFEEEEPIDIKANLRELEKIEPELKKLEEEMKKHLKDLGIR